MERMIKGPKRTLKCYGTPMDPRTIRALEESHAKGPIRKPHANLETTVKPKIKGDIIP